MHISGTACLTSKDRLVRPWALMLADSLIRQVLSPRASCLHDRPFLPLHYLAHSDFNI